MTMGKGGVRSGRDEDGGGAGRVELVSYLLYLQAI